MTQNNLKNILNYNENTGVFIWKKNFKNIKKGDLAGGLKKDGYIWISINNKKYPAHRLAWLYINGEMPVEQIDHKNHNRADNRIDNLREVNNAENHKNRTKQSNNTSGVNGVCWHKRAKRWISRIKVDGETIQLGYFTKFSDAVDARKNAEIQYGFHKNHGQNK